MRSIARPAAMVISTGAVLAGCGEMKMDMTMHMVPPPPAEPGNRIGDATIAQLEVGKSSRAWIIAVLGEPTKHAHVEGQENIEVLRYITAEPSTSALSMISGSASKNVSTTYLILVDGVLQKQWTDRAEEPKLFGSDKKSGGEKQGG